MKKDLEKKGLRQLTIPDQLPSSTDEIWLMNQKVNRKSYEEAARPAQRPREEQKFLEEEAAGKGFGLEEGKKPATKEEIENEKFFQMLQKQAGLELEAQDIFYMEGGRTVRTYRPSAQERKASGEEEQLGFVDDLHQMSAQSEGGSEEWGHAYQGVGDPEPPSEQGETTNQVFLDEAMVRNQCQPYLSDPPNSEQGEPSEAPPSKPRPPADANYLAAEVVEAMKAKAYLEGLLREFEQVGNQNNAPLFTRKIQKAMLAVQESLRTLA